MLRILAGTVVLFVIGGFPLVGSSYAAPNKEEYELQERCGKRAEERFNAEYGDRVTNSKDGKVLTEYTNHYNKKLNKCFVLLTIRKVSYKDKSVSSIIKLHDINENKQYGSFFYTGKGDTPLECKVENKTCSSEDEWNSLIKIYMEE